MITISGIAWLIASAFSNSLAALAMKFATTALELNKVALVGLSLSFYAVAFLFYYLGLRLTPLSTAQPIVTSAAILFVMCFSHFFIGETLSIINILGVGFLALGIFLVSIR